MQIQNTLYRVLLNPVMRSLLRSRFHGFASRNLGILCYRGRRSGRNFFGFATLRRRTMSISRPTFSRVRCMSQQLQVDFGKGIVQ